MQVAWYVIRALFSCISAVANCQGGCAANSLEEQLLAVKKGESKMLCLLLRGCRMLAEGGTPCHGDTVNWLMGPLGPS